MGFRRLLPLLALAALLIAPFGRMAAAEAMAPPHHGTAAAAGHCDGMPAPEQGDVDRSIDCMTACAVVVAPDGAPDAALPRASAPVLRALPLIAGLHPEADPPPPRRS